MTKRVVTRGVIVIIVTAWVSPLAIVAWSSMRPTRQILSPQFNLDDWFTGAHYVDAISKPFFLEAFQNSLVSSLLSTIMCMAAATSAAWASTRRDTVDSLTGFFGWALTTRILPPFALLIPLFLMGQFLGLLNSTLGLSIVLATVNLPLTMWIVRGYFREVPMRVQEAMLLESSRRRDVFFRVVLPLSTRGIVVASFLCFALSWNEYLFALVLSTDPQSKTLSVFTGNFVTGYQIEWGPMFACGTMMLLPPLIVCGLLYPSIVLLVGSSRRRNTA